MGLSIVEVLASHEVIEKDMLAQAFAQRFRAEPHRGYGMGAAEVTHSHPEGQAGAMAVAAAAAIASRNPLPSPRAFLTEVLMHVPEGTAREGIARSLDIAPDEHDRAADVLGTGLDITAPDTVPNCP